jgi:hypothetical protein
MYKGNSSVTVNDNGVFEKFIFLFLLRNTFIDIKFCIPLPYIIIQLFIVYIQMIFFRYSNAKSKYIAHWNP